MLISDTSVNGLILNRSFVAPDKGSGDKNLNFIQGIQPGPQLEPEKLAPEVAEFKRLMLEGEKERFTLMRKHVEQMTKLQSQFGLSGLKVSGFTGLGGFMKLAENSFQNMMKTLGDERLDLADDVRTETLSTVHSDAKKIADSLINGAFFTALSDPAAGQTMLRQGFAFADTVDAALRDLRQKVELEA